MYNGNRYSLTFFSGLFGLFPIHGNFLLVTISLLAWLGGVVVLLRRITNRFGFHPSGLELFLIAEVFANLILWSAPSLSQSFFWRSGMLPYFLPLVSGTWVLAFAASLGEQTEKRWLKAALIFFGAAIVGGFSETGTALWGGFYFLVLIWLLFDQWLREGKLASQYLLPAIAAFLGYTFAAVLLAVSPSTWLRLASSPEPLDFGRLLPLLGWNIRVYLWINLMRRTWMVLTPFLFGLGAGIELLGVQWQNGKKQVIPPNFLKLIGWLVLIGAGTLILIAAVMLPVTLIQSDYPPDRALILGQAVLTGSLITCGILVAGLVGWLVRKVHLQFVFLRKLVIGLSLLCISTTLLAPLGIIKFGVEKWSKYNRWSRLWDQRHIRLVEAGRKNVETIHVMALDHVIEDVGELEIPTIGTIIARRCIMRSMRSSLISLAGIDKFLLFFYLEGILREEVETDAPK
ncbi:MAG: hypothetical protein ACOCYU_04360 [Brevefilum sp.]